MTFSTYFDLLCSRKYFDIFLKYFNSNYGKQTILLRGNIIPPPGVDPKNWIRFVKYQTRRKKKSGEEKEIHYSNIIKRYYGIVQGSFNSHNVIGGDLTTLINDQIHIKDAYESLRAEFGMGKRTAKLVEFDDY